MPPAQQNTQQQPPAAQPAAASVPVMTPDGKAVKMVPQENLQDYISAGGKQVTKLLPPQGQAKWVPNEQVQDFMAAGGINPDQPKIAPPQANMRPMGMGEALGIVSSKDVDNYKNNPYRIRSDEDVNNAALMQPKPGTTGMTHGFGVPVLDTNAYQYKPGVPQDTKDAFRHSDNAQKSAAKVMVPAAVAGTGAAGANALLGPTGIGAVTAGGEEIAGPSLASQALQWLNNLPTWLKVGAGATAGGSAGPEIKKWFLGGGH